MHAPDASRTGGTPQASLPGMAGTRFRLDVDQVGGTLSVDGVDVPDDDVLAAEVIMAPAAPTRLLVHVRAAGVIEGEGIVETVRDAATGETIRQLDPDVIRAAVADRLSYGTDAVTVYRDVIADLIDGAR